MSLGRKVTSWNASIARLGAGTFVGKLGARPEQPVELYDYEACPYCRRVREALTTLDLRAMIYPCPRGGERFRPEVFARGGKRRFPYFVDPNTGAEMFESQDIIRYLFAWYGTGRVPRSLSSSLAIATGTLASAWRAGRGRTARPSRAPAQPLELYSFESSPYCRVVREVLCELEIPYLLNNVGKFSQGRPAFKARAGTIMVPYLVDPNTGREMFESADIITYLESTYGA